MPTRRKNVDLGRIKRSSKKSKLCDYFSSAYVQYLLIFLIWGSLLLINQSTEMRFEYIWPAWLFICSIHDSLKFQGLQYTIVFIIIVVTMDLICFFLFPASWIYSCGSAYVWVYLIWRTDQGLCFLTLVFCFIFVYFELGFYSREAKINQSIYLFRPFAAHSIGYPVVCMGFSIKRYLDVRHRKLKKMDVQKQNCLYFRILREAVPLSAISECSGNGYPSVYLPHTIHDTSGIENDTYTADVPGSTSPWLAFLLRRLGKSFCTRFAHWALSQPRLLGGRDCGDRLALHPTCHSYPRAADTNNNSSQALISASPDQTVVRRATALHTLDAHTPHSANSTVRRFPAVDNPIPIDPSTKVRPASCGKGGGGRPTKEDLTTRLENSARRLRTEVQSMRAVESQLRNQLTNLERDDRLNRLRLSDQRQKNESLSADIAKLTAQCRTERSNLTSVEQSLAEEKRLLQSLEEQLITEVPIKEEQPALDASVHDTLTTTVQGKSVQTTPLDGSIECGSVKSVSPNSTDLVEASCCQRRRRLEAEVCTRRAACRQQEEQLRALSGARARQANHNQQHQFSKSSKHSIVNGHEELRSHRSGNLQSDSMGSEDSGQQSLETRVQLAIKEGERLNDKLREENWMKQELLTSYHNSVREIYDLNKTHKQRDFQILELTMKIEQLECFTGTNLTGDGTYSGSLRRDSVQQPHSFADKSLAKSTCIDDTSSSCVVPAFTRSHTSVSWRFEDGVLPGEHCYGPSLDGMSGESNQSMLNHSVDLVSSSSSDRTGYFDRRLVAQPHIGTTVSTSLVSSAQCGGNLYNPGGRIGVDEYGSCQTTHFPFAEANCSDLRPPCMSNHVRSGGVDSMQRLSTETH
ncbi:hypothetical protein EG68_07589 [Paragonimus skrjabini miyazakii]|uniref:Macoilin n=1 Tax=Paragonimus skrjabini miyazakii TaxID=59628 RepID=A0A8S9YC39_9TREM|nr:hypothetical protein EG68_07589 [Paragonimus skrjabini miyazakii]